MKFYTWRQNNSGGVFDGPACIVSVQDAGIDAAKAKAEALGLYFDGEGDCPTCGDRWHAEPSEIGEAPTLYELPVPEAAAQCMGRTWLIAYADGREERGS